MIQKIALCAALTAMPFILFAETEKKTDKKKLYSGKKIQALLITGGCCHNYPFQATALTSGIEEQVNVEFTVVNEGGKGTRAQISLYDDPKWADPYDVIIHNECFADTVNPEYIRKITKAHESGKPALVIHCAMHTYRSAKIDDWKEVGRNMFVLRTRKC